jgi:hypothetical protein
MLLIQDEDNIHLQPLPKKITVLVNIKKLWSLTQNPHKPRLSMF